MRSKELPIPTRRPRHTKHAAKSRANRKTTSPTPRKSDAAAKRRDLIIRTLDKMKAEDIAAIDISRQSSFADYMIVASGRSQRHVTSLADDVVRALKEKHVAILSIEGKLAGDWVLIDAGSVVVHIFRPEVRRFYNIEKMWAIPTPTRA